MFTYGHSLNTLNTRMCSYAPVLWIAIFYYTSVRFPASCDLNWTGTIYDSNVTRDSHGYNTSSTWCSTWFSTYAARDAARDSPRDAARDAARDSARDAACDAARDSAHDAASITQNRPISIKSQSETINLIRRNWGINTEFVGFINQSLALRSCFRLNFNISKLVYQWPWAVQLARVHRPSRCPPSIIRVLITTTRIFSI